ncbi:Alpha/beta hydrolase fold-3 [Penicillium griseofulvum]|uniref:Alpha/beta hydrolase fold-3 n=1 Tax=Penicillium patulum TaxID=5078 RepID=A0A135LFP1_PENPA|nr:Alpha/beta hydrolase fold-3 [Penicillium griseofulvum]KXG47755.1 Alpha/beta hydrolase fold-3 [Penicillium griseofulvum]
MNSILTAPFAPLLYLSRRFRQDPEWSYRQALGNTFIKVFLRIFVVFRTKPPLSLKPGLDGDRFVVIEPGPPELYTTITVDDEIQPVAVGGTWFPSLYQYNTTTTQDKHVVLYFHGGSYILGDGRSSSCQFVANSLLSHTPISHVFSLQYRLACNPNGRFPAQLQDAISAYSYLLHTLHIPASRIVFSGDSAGGHLVLALLRYIMDYDDEKVLPSPTCSWLFSPWCDIPGARIKHLWQNIPNVRTDYIPPSFPAWGAKHLIGNLQITPEFAPYLAPIWYPFVLPSPVLIVSGGREVMCQEHDRLARHLSKMQQNEGRVEYFVQDLMPHDIMMVAWILNFRKEADQCAVMAGTFLTRMQASEEDSTTVPSVAY